MGPVKPDLPVRTMTLILKTFTRNHIKIKLETLVFNLHLWHFGVHGLLPSVYPSVVRPVIRQLEEPAPDPVIGLPSPGALENPPGISRTLSSVTVTGEPDPGSGPNTSGASSSDIRYGRSSGASSTSIGCCRTLLTAEANSDSDQAYQSSLMFITSWIPNSWSIDCFSEFAGVSYLVASCSSGVFRLIRVNPGGTLSASVGCRASGCLDNRRGLDAMLAQDGVEKLRSAVSSTPSLRYLSHLSSTAASSGFCRSAVGPGSVQNCSLSDSP